MSKGKFLSLIFFVVTLSSGCVAQPQRPGVQAGRPNVAQRNVPSSFGERRQAIASGRIKEFLAAMEARAAAAETRGDWAEASNAYYEAAAASQLSGQLQKGTLHGHKAVELGQVAGDKGLQANPMQILALTYGQLGQFDKQREWLERGLEVSKDIIGTGLPGRFHADLAGYFSRQGDNARAIEHGSRAVQLLDLQLNSIRKNARAPSSAFQTAESNLIGALQRLGNAYLGAGNGSDALKSYERALALVKISKAKPLAEASLFAGIGRAYLAQKNFSRALDNLTTALQMAESRSETSLVQTASNALGQVYLRNRREAEAIPYFKKAIDSIESTRSLLDSEEYRTSFFANQGQAYNGIIQAQLAVKNFADAFSYSERARSRAFLDVLGSKIQLARSGTLMEHERALQARISVLRAMMDGEEADSSQTSDLRNELAEAERDYTDYLSKLRKENKEQVSLMNVEPLTLKQAQELLEPGVTMLEYFIVQGSVYLWVVEKDRVEFVSASIARKDLVAKVTELRDTIYQFGEKGRFTALSQELHKLLIQPALSLIRGKELIVVPHDVLHYLPFQALQSGDGRYLIERFPIYYLSSASLMQFTQEKRKAKGELSSVIAQGGKLLTFGNPDLNDPKMALQFAEIEAKEIKSLYPQSSIYLQKEATEEKAKTLSPQHDIIHFASHAELNENDPLASAIRLAKSDKEDGRLEVREIFGMDLKASLVVLSACETGLGKLSSGDELIGLTRAFIYAGTPSVVASLWNVEDSSTAQLMASFYKNLKTMTKVEALRQAQLNLIRGNVSSDLLARRGIGGVGKLGEVPAAKSPSQDSVSISTSHPFFWAPFILVGEGK